MAPPSRLTRGVEHGSPALLELDHVSIEVPSLAEAIGRFAHVLGLHLTVTPEAPDRHGRVYLDRAYLEVAAHPASRTWSIASFFLRFSDRERLEDHLQAAGLAYQHHGYEGIDGRWEDIELEVAGAWMPVLVRRIEPADVARNWPPSLNETHRGGAFTIAAVHVPAASLEGPADAYARLLGAPLAGDTRDPTQGRRRTFRAGSARIVVVEGHERPAVVLGVPSLAVSGAELPSALLPPDEEGVAWFDQAQTADVAIGLTEVEPSKRG